jgi:hypothetical protein
MEMKLNRALAVKTVHGIIYIYFIRSIFQDKEFGRVFIALVLWSYRSIVEAQTI